MAVAFIAGIILSFTLAWQGLFGTGLKFSASTTLTGTTARVMGGRCAFFGCVLLGGVECAVLRIVGDKH